MSTEAMNLVSKNPAYIPFRLRREFLLYLDTLIEHLNQSGWRMGDTELNVESYAIEQQVITKIEKKREKEEERFASDGENISARFYEQNSYQERFETITWTQAIAQNKRLAIKGGPGSGKTFSTKATVIQKARELQCDLKSFSTSFDHPFEIPIWITATELANCGDEKVADALIRILKSTINEPRISNGIFFKWLKSQISPVFETNNLPKRIFLVIDSLDELSSVEFDSFSRLANQLDVAGVHLVTTCRTLQWESRRGLLEWHNLKSLELATLKRRQKIDFIKHFFSTDEKLRNSAKTLLQNNHAVDYATDSSLILTFVCFLHLEGKVDDSTTYIDIYKQMQTKLFEGYWKPQDDKPYWFVDEDTQEYIEYLEKIALRIFTKAPNENSFTLTSWNQAADSCGLSKEEAKKFRKKLVDIGFLVKSGVDARNKECWSFLHRTLLEFSAAKALVETDGWLVESKDRFWDFAWTETLTFLAGLLDKHAVRQLIAALEEEREIHSTEIFGWLIYLEARFTGVSKLEGKEIEKICDLIIYGMSDDWVRRGVIEYKPEERKRSIGDWNIYEPFIKHAFSYLELNKKCSIYFFEELIEKLLTALKNDDSSVRVSAAFAFRSFGQANEKIIDALLAALRDEDYSVRGHASYALGNLGQVNEKVIEALLPIALNEVHYPVRVSAAETIGKLGQADKKVKDTLLTVLKDDVRGGRISAAAVLGEIGKGDEKVSDALLTALGDDDSRVRSSAARAFGKLGKADEKVIDALLTALGDDDSWVRGVAAESLGKLGQADEKVTDALLAALKIVNDNVLDYAAESLGELGQADEKVIEALLAALRDDDSRKRGSAARALGKLGKTDERVINALVTALTDDEKNVRHSTAIALGKLGKADETVIDALLTVLQDHDLEVRSRAAEALGKLGNTNERVINVLLIALNDSSWVRQKAAIALGKLGIGSINEFDETLPWRIILELSFQLDKSTYLLNSNYSIPLFEIWQAFRINENNLILTWEMLEMRKIELYRKTLELNPDDYETAFNLGITYNHKGELDKAIECWQKAIEIKPDHSMAFRNLGFVYGKEGELDKAIECYQKALKIEPDNSNLWNGLGFTFIKSGDLRSANKALLKVIELGELALGNMNLGHVYLAQGLEDEAITCYQKSLANFREKSDFWDGMDDDLQYLKQYGITEKSYQGILKDLKNS